jgi:hypothetical protein
MQVPGALITAEVEVEGAGPIVGPCLVILLILLILLQRTKTQESTGLWVRGAADSQAPRDHAADGA